MPQGRRVILIKYCGMKALIAELTRAAIWLMRPRERCDVLGTHRAVFLAACRDGELLESIALLVIALGQAEMKRMFVRADARGIGLGRRLLNALEEVACHRGITRISLETGIKQPEAIGLYRASGYQDCPPFGDYKADPLSLFMTKNLSP